jgi:hypothetical protein
MCCKIILTNTTPAALLARRLAAASASPAKPAVVLPSSDDACRPLLTPSELSPFEVRTINQGSESGRAARERGGPTAMPHVSIGTAVPAAFDHHHHHNHSPHGGKHRGEACPGGRAPEEGRAKLASGPSCRERSASKLPWLRGCVWEDARKSPQRRRLLLHLLAKSPARSQRTR